MRLFHAPCLDYIQYIRPGKSLYPLPGLRPTGTAADRSSHRSVVSEHCGPGVLGQFQLMCMCLLWFCSLFRGQSPALGQLHIIGPAIVRSCSVGNYAFGQAWSCRNQGFIARQRMCLMGRQEQQNLVYCSDCTDKGYGQRRMKSRKKLAFDRFETVVICHCMANRIAFVYWWDLRGSCTPQQARKSAKDETYRDSDCAIAAYQRRMHPIACAGVARSRYGAVNGGVVLPLTIIQSLAHVGTKKESASAVHAACLGLHLTTRLR